MRTLTQLILRQPSQKASDIVAVRDWLSSAGFRPREIRLDESIKAELRKPKPSVSVLPADHDIYLYQAFEILATVPLTEEERHHAVETASIAVLWEDMHGNSVWGLVGVDSPAVDVRWR